MSDDGFQRIKEIVNTPYSFGRETPWKDRMNSTIGTGDVLIPAQAGRRREIHVAILEPKVAKQGILNQQEPLGVSDYFSKYMPARRLTDITAVCEDFLLGPDKYSLPIFFQKSPLPASLMPIIAGLAVKSDIEELTEIIDFILSNTRICCRPLAEIPLTQYGYHPENKKSMLLLATLIAYLWIAEKPSVTKLDRLFLNRSKPPGYYCANNIGDIFDVFIYRPINYHEREADVNRADIHYRATDYFTQLTRSDHIQDILNYNE